MMSAKGQGLPGAESLIPGGPASLRCSLLRSGQLDLVVKWCEPW